MLTPSHRSPLADRSVQDESPVTLDSLAKAFRDQAESRLILIEAQISLSIQCLDRLATHDPCEAIWALRAQAYDRLKRLQIQAEELRRSIHTG